MGDPEVALGVALGGSQGCPRAARWHGVTGGVPGGTWGQHGGQRGGTGGGTWGGPKVPQGCKVAWGDSAVPGVTLGSQG